MILTAVVSGLALSLFMITGWFIFGPQGSLAKESHAKGRVFASSGSLRASETPDFEQIHHFSDIDPIHRFLSGLGFAERLANSLKRINSRISVSTLLFLCLAVGALFFLFLSRWMPGFLALVISLAIAVLPFFYIRYQSARYIAKFSEHLPNALSIISNSIKVGHGLEVAVAAVSGTAPYPVSVEFERVRAEMQLGQPLEEAMQNLYHRIQTSDLKIFVTAMLVHQELGGNLSEILENLERTIRERFALRREIKALSAQGVLSSQILFSLPFVMIAIWTAVDPELLMQYANSEMGHFLIAISIVLQIVAFFWMRRITTLKDS